MKHFSLEEELREPVNEWVRSQGLEPVNEYPICWRIPDVLGVRDCKIEVAIELKLSDLKTAIFQASIYRLIAEKVYVAMPSNRQPHLLKRIKEFNYLGIGILLVRGDLTTFRLLEGRPFDPIFSHI